MLSLAIGFFVACPLLIIACLLTDGWPTLDATSLGYTAWVGLIEMALGFLCWQTAMRRTQRAALLGQFIFLAPFISLWLIHNVLGEPVSSYTLVGLIGIAAGLLISSQDA